MATVLPENTAEHGIRRAHVHQHGADQCRQAAHIEFGEFFRYAFSFHQAVKLGPVLAITRVAARIHQIKMLVALQAQPQPLDTRFDHVGSANQHRPRDAFVHHQLRGAQETFLLALGIHHAFR